MWLSPPISRQSFSYFYPLFLGHLREVRVTWAWVLFFYSENYTMSKTNYLNLFFKPEMSTLIELLVTRPTRAIYKPLDNVKEVIFPCAVKMRNLRYDDTLILYHPLPLLCPSVIPPFYRETTKPAEFQVK